MKLWLISQTENDDYDTYDSAIVCAENEAAAIEIHPSKKQTMYYDGKEELWYESHSAFKTWASTRAQVKVRYIGEADPSVAEGVVLASLNAS